MRGWGELEGLGRALSATVLFATTTPGHPPERPFVAEAPPAAAPLDAWAAAAPPAAARPGRREALERAALDLVGRVGGLAVGPAAEAPATAPAGTCPPERLAVRWSAPPPGFVQGAHLEPVGPEPGESTERVNGIVVCEGSTFAYLGFEALWGGDGWLVQAVPWVPHEEEEPAEHAEAPGGPEVWAPAAPPARPRFGDLRSLPAPALWRGRPIENLAGYVRQSTCDPSAKPGVAGTRDLLLRSFRGSRNLGIGRSCEVGGASEHKEGRALDWGLHSDNPSERAMADQFLAWLLGADADGHRYAMARRLGVMYVIWDGHIWSSWRADDGWRPYVGASSHRDHLHISFSWAGALAETSFWRDGVAAAEGGAPKGPPPGRTSPPHHPPSGRGGSGGGQPGRDPDGPEQPGPAPPPTTAPPPPGSPPSQPDLTVPGVTSVAT